jgi:hypothetical protein
VMRYDASSYRDLRSIVNSEKSGFSVLDSLRIVFYIVARYRKTASRSVSASQSGGTQRCFIQPEHRSEPHVQARLE